MVHAKHDVDATQRRVGTPGGVECDSGRPPTHLPEGGLGRHGIEPCDLSTDSPGVIPRLIDGGTGAAVSHTFTVARGNS